MKPGQFDKHPDYYEAILQIRPVDETVLNFVIESVEKRNDVYISKVKDLKTGYDVYLTNQRFSRGALVTQLKKRFRNSKVLVTKSLYGQDKMSSKLIYRATVLFRLEK